jgi:hypothetical protein
MTRRRLRASLLVAVALAAAGAACTEQLSTGANCPALCPGQDVVIRDTVLTPAIVLDTTLAPYPFLGYEQPLLLALRGDTLDTRVIVRFDTLVRDFAPSGDTLRPITQVDSASVSIRLLRTKLALPATFHLDVYDVNDTTLVDSIPSNLIPSFTPARLVGSLQVDSATYKDSAVVHIPVDTTWLMAAIREPLAGVRVGIRVRAGGVGVALHVSSSDDPINAPRLRYRPTASPGGSDSTAVAFAVFPTSRTPTTPQFANADYVDYSLVVAAPNLRAPGRFAAGGIPTARSYLRFDLPLWVTDSSYVVRAQLELVQDPIRGLDQGDSIVVFPQLVIAGHSVTELRRAVTLLAPAGFCITYSIRRAPADSGVVSFEINSIVRQWVSTNGVRPIPTAIVLRAAGEGSQATGLRFFGLGAPAAVRPRIRLSYVRNANFGRP